MVNTTLKRPVLGLMDMSYLISTSTLSFQVNVVAYTTSAVSFFFATDLLSNIVRIKVRILGVDNNFQPAFSMNYYDSVILLINLEFNPNSTDYFLKIH